MDVNAMNALTLYKKNLRKKIEERRVVVREIHPQMEERVHRLEELSEIEKLI